MYNMLVKHHLCGQPPLAAGSLALTDTFYRPNVFFHTSLYPKNINATNCFFARIKEYKYYNYILWLILVGLGIIQINERLKLVKFNQLFGCPLSRFDCICAIMYVFSHIYTHIGT